MDMVGYESAQLAIDCTAGGGGHLAMALARMPAGGRVLAFDRDEYAIKHLQSRFAKEIGSGRLILVHGAFSTLDRALELNPDFRHVDVILADLGVSSPQLDLSERGFSFQHSGPLDMRMNQSEETETAADIVNHWSEQDICKLLREFGEEPKARFIAQAIVARRNEKPFMDTGDLAQVVAGAIHYREKSRKHPATKTFQALRIQVNHELDELNTLLCSSFQSLKSGGRLAIITFHSLEDKAVKRTFRRLAGDSPKSDMLAKLPFSEAELQEAKQSQGRILKPFPASAPKSELESNPRSRSAKLRVIAKL